MNKTGIKLTALLLASLLASAALCACEDAPDSESTDSSAEQTVFVGEEVEAETATGDEYVTEKKYYMAIHYGDVYTCRVIDRGGNVAKELELPAEPTVELKNGNRIICLTYGDTDDISKTKNYYYDQATDRSSIEFTYVLDELYAENDNALVITFEDGALYVRGMFYVNGELYRMEIPLSKKLADTDAPVVSASFADSTTFEVEYTTADGELFKETVSIAE